MSRLEHSLQIEDASSRTIYVRYEIDDGWTKEHPLEIIELIDMKIKKSYAKAMKTVLNQNRNHKGAWITADIASKYEARSWIYRVLYDAQYIYQMRELGLELQQMYGVTEVEAINILNGQHVQDYLNKYYRIQHKIPVHIDAQKICDDILIDYRRNYCG